MKTDKILTVNEMGPMSGFKQLQYLHGKLSDFLGLKSWLILPLITQLATRAKLMYKSNTILGM